MNGKLIDRSCGDFAAVLASKSSVPGGGGAAALVGALGVALGSMVGNFTLGKKKYARYEADIQRVLEEGEALRQQLLALVDEDAAAFEPLSRAYAIPKDDPSHDAVLEEATLNACKAPMEMVDRCGQAIDLLSELLEKGSVMLVSDVGCGALLCMAAMEAAAMNVYINTGSLLDREKARLMEAAVDRQRAEYGPKADAIVNAVQARIRKG